MILNEKSADHDLYVVCNNGQNLSALKFSKDINISVRNYCELVNAYGLSEVTQAVDELLHRAKREFGVNATVSLRAADRILIEGWDAAISTPDYPAADINQWLELHLADLVLEPVRVDGGSVHLDIALVDTGPGWLESRFASGPQVPSWDSDCDFTRNAYRADMALVSPVLAALGGFSRSERDRLHVDICWRPICAERWPGSAVFFEASLGIVDANGQFVIADRVIEAAERLGLVYLIDQYLVSRVVEELISAPGAVSLSVSVSGRCLMNSRFWRGALNRLKMGGAVAHDLIVEIRCGAACHADAGWTDTIDLLKSAGCRTSLANFGLGAASLGDVASFAPNLVTVDKQFLSPAGQVRFSDAVLSHLIGLAHALGAEVVIDGVDSFELASASHSLGASLFKGEWFGRPRIYRSWAHRSETSENYLCAG